MPSRLLTPTTRCLSEGKDWTPHAPAGIASRQERPVRACFTRGVQPGVETSMGRGIMAATIH